MDYENLLAICVTILALALAFTGLDDGAMVRTVVGAYLGFLAGRKKGKK